MEENVGSMNENVSFIIIMRWYLSWMRSADLWMKIAAGQELLGDLPGDRLGQARSVGA
jgi:hypothetical protein